MKNTISRILIMSSLAILVACGGGGDDTSTNDTNDGSTALSLVNAFGISVQTDTAQLPATISTICYEDNSVSPVDGIKDTLTISGTTVTYSSSKYTADTTCSNTPTITSFTADLTVDQDVSIVDWVDSQNQSATAPAKASDSGTQLSATAPYTRINITITESNFPGVTVGMQSNQGYVIDDSSSDGVILYRVDESSLASIVDPFTTIPVSSTPPSSGGPDIRVIINSVERTAYADSKITYTVTNYGDAATGSFQVMGWADRASAPDLGSAGSGKFNSHADLSANGGSEQGTIIIDSVTLTTGAELNAYVIADYNQEVGETDEGVTGTNDNLGHKAWTVQDIFIFGSASLIEQSPTTVISAIYDGTYTTIKLLTSGDTAITLQVVLVGEAGPATYSTSLGTIGQAFVVQSGATYMTSAVPANSAVSFTIAEGDIAGNPISGTYSMELCSAWSSFTNCSGVLKTYTGSFSMIRDPDQ